jgi:hypothetical protein
LHAAFDGDEEPLHALVTDRFLALETRFGLQSARCPVLVEFLSDTFFSR